MNSNIQLFAEMHIGNERTSYHAALRNEKTNESVKDMEITFAAYEELQQSLRITNYYEKRLSDIDDEDESKRDNTDPLPLVRAQFYNDKMISKIESALGFELYQWQIDFLRGKGIMMKSRGTGKTVVYWIDVFLIDRSALDFSILSRRDRGKYGYAKIIHDKLKNGGLDVREVNFGRLDHEEN